MNTQEKPLHRMTRKELEAVVNEWTEDLPEELPEELFASGDPIDDLARWEGEGGR